MDPIPVQSLYSRMGQLPTVMEPTPIWEDQVSNNDQYISDYQPGSPSPRYGTPFTGASGGRSNYSMAESPGDNDDYDSRRVSLSIADVFKFKEARNSQLQVTQPSTIQGPSPMEDLTDSFSQLKTAGPQQDAEQRRMMMSTDTMGTIEGINAGSVADMSLGTMNSSTFSLFGGRGNDSINMVGWNGDGSSGSGSSGQQHKPSFLDIPSNQDKVVDPSLASSGLTAHSGSSTIRTPSSRSNMTAYAMDSTTSLFNDSTLFRSTGSVNIDGAIEAVRRQVQSEYASMTSLPRPTDLHGGDSSNLDRLGDSSLSMLRKAFSDDDIGGL